MITVVAQVESPYETKDDRPPLAVGLFVEAEIIGHTIGNVFVLPRSAMQTNKQVYVVGKDSRLQFRDVEILRTVGEKVYITAGFNARETVCLSTVSNAIEGMLVKPARAPELQVSK
jgi:multidrug efflux pump subunit AcrA (membrane-fusion protein)